MRVALLIFVLAVPILSGCQLVSDNRTTVHQYPDGTEPPVIRRIEHILEDSGYRVALRPDASPYRGHGNTLVYGGGAKGLFEAHKIIARLEAGPHFVANVFERQAQNHHYSESNIGLYLDSDLSGEEGRGTVEIEADPLSVQDLEFEATGCGESYIAHFERSGSVAFYSAMGELLEQASWKAADAHSLSVLGGQDNRYEIVESDREYEDGVKRTVSLLPQGYYRMPYGCVYSGWLVERTKLGVDRRR